MEDGIHDMFSVADKAVRSCCEDRCKTDPPEIAKSIDNLHSLVLALVYDPCMTPQNALRVANVVANAFNLGRGMERLARVLERKA